MTLDRDQNGRHEATAHLDAAVPAAPPPTRADVIIVGAGIAGSLLALALARRDLNVVIVDPRASYPRDFRCEKFSAEQLALLNELDALDQLEAAERATRGDDARGDGLVNRGLRYDHMVNAVRAAWPDSVAFMQGRASRLETGEGEQRLTLAGGAVVEGRLIVLATGSCQKLLAPLGIRRRMLSERHSVTIGLSIRPKDRAAFPFMTMVGEGTRAGDRIAFVSLFPMGNATRVNLFAYHDPRDPWTRAFRDDPVASLMQVLPGFGAKLGEISVTSPVEIRATDLYEAEGHIAPGVVLIGDAFRTSCPATGMGVTRALTDVRQLSGLHVPAWLSTPGMASDKIAQFYADPVKQAVDATSTRRAVTGRLKATDTSLRWQAQRSISRVWRLSRRTTGRFTIAVKARAASTGCGQTSQMKYRHG